jgi:peptidoglycan L-alanyl-D-glutamate endopeptidase CwlK
MPQVWYVIQGYRTHAEQDALYAQGRTTPGPIVTRAKGGQSPHNWGLAIDVVPDRDLDTAGLQPDWNNDPAYLELAARCKRHPRLKSGISFGDKPHIERYKWRNHVKPTSTG